MGGNVSRTVLRRAARPIRNINVEERAQNTVERHKVKPVRAPLHPSTKEVIEKQVSGTKLCLMGISDYSHIEPS